jgi:Cu(I)-responsive transcriptional regulator
MTNHEGAPYSIGDLALQSGTKVETIRYYEKAGLIPQAARTAGNHRTYTQAHAHRLAFIRHSRELGFSLDRIRTLLALADEPEQSCADVDAIALEHLSAVRERIERLQLLEAELVRMVDECGCGRVAECRVIEVLADQTHARCLTRDHAGANL